jgi:tRNA pseudouridine38-40 synthase
LTKTRIKLVVAYDGTDFCGWAAQAGRRTVQGTLKEAVRQVSGEDYEIVGASRTDSGAHARGQVAHFDSETGIPPDKWADVLNRVLPADVKVKDSRSVSSDFSSRFSVLDRTYVYQIAKSDRDPFLIRYAHAQRWKMNLQDMARGAEKLVGKHDFRAFTEELDETVHNTVREMFAVKVEDRKDRVEIQIVGTAFLRGMMRRMSGCLYEIGCGRRPADDIDRLLDPKQRDGLMWPVVLPACGLTLMRIRYGRWPRDNRMPLDKEDDLDNE